MRVLQLKIWRRLGLTALPLLTVALAFSVGRTDTQATHFSSPTPLWGYEAAGTNARILQYDVGTDMFVSSCVPSPSQNGRGLAFDPTDGNLWYTFVPGDGLIHKATTGCTTVGSIPFGDGPGGTIQDDVGALDIDPDDGQIWAAGYTAVGGQMVLYKVNRVSGAVLQSCTVPPGDGFQQNDTLAVAKLSGLPGSGKYLLTDAAEFFSTTLLFVDAATCVGGGPATIATTRTLPFGITGLDFEQNTLIATNLSTIVSFGSPPFPAVLTVQATMSAAPSGTLEDITLQTGAITTPGKVTGGGTIEDPVFSPTGDLLSLPAITASTSGGGAQANFGFVISDGTTPKGNLLYDDHGAGVRIKATSYATLAIGNGACGPNTHAKFIGMATVNGTPGQSLTVEVDDCGEPGSSPGIGPDTFSITAGSYSNSGPLIGGNIQIHK